MYVAFEKEVLDDEAAFLAIQSIFKCFSDLKHHWYIPDDRIKDSRFCQDPGWLGRSALALYYKAFGAKRPDCWLQVTHRPESSHEMSPAAAAEFLSKPLSILVENAEYDGPFIAELARLFSSKLNCALDRNHVVIEHGGGSSITGRARTLASGNCRLFVMTDSDKLWPCHQHGKWDEMKQLCAENEIPLHILAKREMENYIPEDWIQSWIAKQPLRKRNNLEQTLTVFRSLDPLPKDFYDMKIGFSRLGDQKEHELKHKALFNGQSETDLESIQHGFGKSVGQALTLSSRPGNAAKAFRNRSNHGSKRGESEVELLVKKLEQQL